MIKIDLNTKKKGLTKCVISGSVEVSGDTNIVAHEIYAIIKDLEENTPEALEIAIELLIDSHGENIDDV